MKHPSRWPWLLRFPVFIAILLILWWGPILAALVGLSAWGVFKAVGSGWGFVLGGVILLGWSSLIMKFVIHTHIEPLFNIRSMQNSHKELFTPEPVHSFREWVRLMFFGR
jgi:hypothetical protein